MTSSTEFVMNGKNAAVHVSDQTPLLYVIRNELDHKGTRFGCGTGNCGACTVIVDGQAVQSCDTPLWSVAQKSVLTAEGLVTDPIGKMLQAAFITEQAAQCGYCINGILMSVTALLHKNASPSREDLNESLNRHLCRCGTHIRILRAIDRVIAQLKEGVSQ